MKEIYQAYSTHYDELVHNEDYQSNLSRALHEGYDFNGRSGYEFGVGTGRLTKIVLDHVSHVRCFDRSSHMLDKAKANLRNYSEKVQFGVLENNEIGSLSDKLDFVIEGWSFGHTIFDNQDDVDSITKLLVESCERLVAENGALIFIETLGTNVDNPQDFTGPLGDFYNQLEHAHGMQRKVVRTDYQFESVNEASRIMGFFFGSDMSVAVEKRGSTIIPEHTGIWTKLITDGRSS